MDIDTMKPGPELDAMVARLVMGWELCDDGETWSAEVGKHGTSECLCEQEDFRPSTDIAAAWMVVEKLRERWGQICIVAGLQWHCYQSEADMARTKAAKMGSADTAPHAICLAALKSVS